MHLLQWLSNGLLGLRYERQVRLISEALGGDLRPSATDTEAMRRVVDGFRNPAKQERKARAPDVLWVLMSSVPALNQIVSEHHLDRNGLDQLLDRFYVAGGATWCAGQFVPVSALTHPKTLRYALSKAGQVNGYEWAATLTQMVASRDWFE